VADETGRLVDDLLPSDLLILDNYLAVFGIREFSHLQDLPLQIGILLDVSTSVRKTVPGETMAGRLLVQQLLRPQTDNAFLMEFGSDTRLWQSPTNDRVALARGLERIQQRGDVTKLYDGLFIACASQFSENDFPKVAHRVIVVFSDGVDTDSFHGLADVIALAQNNEVQLYAVSVHSRRSSWPGDEVLRRMTEQTGGRLFVADSERDFPFIFAAMEKEMRTQYAVSFQPAERSLGFHSLQVELVRHQRLHVHARQGYFFTSP
jgi:VWFA-related protein